MVSFEEFLKRCKNFHGDRFDYSKSNFMHMNKEITITCKEHGDFKQTPEQHLIFKKCCKQCKRISPRRKTTQKFIEESVKKHGNRYDYSKVDYIGITHKVTIICSVHGEFSQKPGDHINGRGCDKCGGTYQLTTDDFLQRMKNIPHFAERNYDFSKVVYRSANSKVVVTCPKHGEWQAKPSMLMMGIGCRQCVARVFTTVSFIEEANRVHKNKYDYSKCVYTGMENKVIIVCPIHGIEFHHKPQTHLVGRSGCKKCKSEVYSRISSDTQEDWLKKANKISNSRFLFDKVKYVNYKTPVIVTCVKHNKDFKIKPVAFIQGQGCPICAESSGERRVRTYFTDKNICFVPQHSFDDCVYRNKLKFDFAVLNQNKSVKFLVEYHGEQHYTPIKHFGGEKTFKQTQIRDNIKLQYAQNNNIPLLVIPYTDNNIEETLSNFLGNQTLL